MNQYLLYKKYLDINERFSGHGQNHLLDKLILFKHDYSLPNMLQVKVHKIKSKTNSELDFLFPNKILTTGSDLYEGCTLEAVISIQPLETKTEIRPHSLSVHSYKSPTFCDYCGVMLFGMFKQVAFSVYMIMTNEIIILVFRD